MNFLENLILKKSSKRIDLRIIIYFSIFKMGIELNLHYFYDYIILVVSGVILTDIYLHLFNLD